MRGHVADLRAEPTGLDPALESARTPADAEVDRLVEADALDVEIRAAVLETLQAFGVVVEFPGPRHGPRGTMR